MHGLRLLDWQVLPERNLIARNGITVHLEPKTMEVLLELARHPGEVVSKAHLMRSVWNGIFVCEDVVTNAVSLLRRALGDHVRSPSLIQTVPKRGYRLIAAIAQESVPDPCPDDLQRCLLRVRFLRHEETLESLHSAHASCEEIVRQEPNCSAAYAELVLTLFLLEKLGAVRREQIEVKVRSAVERALSLDEHAGMSLVCLAKQEYRYDCKWPEAEQHFRQAVAVSPDDADVSVEFSIALSCMRRFDESLLYSRRSCVLDRVSPAARLQAGHLSYASGRYEAAICHYRRLLRFSPHHVFARWGLADALVRTGQTDAAFNILKEGLSMAGLVPLLLTSLSRNEGRFDCEAQLPQQTDDPVLLAEFYGVRGEFAKAFELLHRAADIEHYRLAVANMFPQFEVLRENPRYEQFLTRLGLPPNPVTPRSG